MDKPTPEQEAAKLAELQALLDAAGVVNFTAHELTWLPKAIPPHHEFPKTFTKLVAIAVVAQEIRSEHGHPLTVSSAFRPLWYNLIVANSSTSAHIEAAAMDLNARNAEEGVRLHAILERFWAAKRFNGYGKYRKLPRRAHIDLGKKGHRRWSY